MDMIATVINTNPRSLLVRDFKTNDEVIVLYNGFCNFAPNDCVRIKFVENMTHNVPHQITAISIWEIECPD